MINLETSYEQQYLNCLRYVLATGTLHENRTGTRTIRIPGYMMVHDLRKGFPLLTTKKMAWKLIVHELLGFIHGKTTVEGLGPIWEKDANENGEWLANPHRQGDGDLGPVYGSQWRQFRGVSYVPGKDRTNIDDMVVTSVDQLLVCVQQILTNPDSRRNIVIAWNPTQLKSMALVPCHVLFRFSVDRATGTLNVSVYQRSCDLFLGVPFNMTSYSLFLQIVAMATGLTPGYCTHFLDDTHIYENHFDQVNLQLTREPLAPPSVHILDPFKGLTQLGKSDKLAMDFMESLKPEHFELVGYDESHPAIKAVMATTPKELPKVC